LVEGKLKKRLLERFYGGGNVESKFIFRVAARVQRRRESSTLM